jgi:hypothetical protein
MSDRQLLCFGVCTRKNAGFHCFWLELTWPRDRGLVWAYCYAAEVRVVVSLLIFVLDVKRVLRFTNGSKSNHAYVIHIVVISA